MDNRWSVWLEPCRTDTVRYRKLISEYCEKFSSPVFNPHITLFGRVGIEPESTFSFFEDLISNYASFSVNVLGVTTGEPPWKSLFIQLEVCEALLNLQAKINDLFKSFRRYTFDPHLSLAYGDLTINQNEMDAIPLPESIRFSGVALVMTPDTIENWKNIKKYSLVDQDK